MARFDLLAAIDLRAGRVVRLRQGDFGQETAYAEDPVAVARDLVDRGVDWLHVVDLDGARTGQRAHAAAIAGIVDAVGDRASAEVAGGLRSRDAVAEILELGATRAVVGTAALADPDFGPAIATLHGSDRIAIALDVRAGSAVGDGWAEAASGRPFEDTISRLAAGGVRWFEVTAIDRDGTLEGPDLALLQRALAASPGVDIIASGGIATVEDLIATRAIGCVGAIVGRAIYEGTLDLDRAIRATMRP